MRVNTEPRACRILREAGATEPPRTLDDFAQVARKMTDSGRSRYGYYALGATGWSYPSLVFFGWIQRYLTTGLSAGAVKD